MLLQAWYATACRYPRLYPHAPLGVRLQNATGLSRSSIKCLLAQLQSVAKEHASDGQICAFALAEAGAEYLQSNNHPAQDKKVLVHIDHAGVTPAMTTPEQRHGLRSCKSLPLRCRMHPCGTICNSAVMLMKLMRQICWLQVLILLAVRTCLEEPSGGRLQCTRHM